MSKWRFDNMDAAESAFLSNQLEAIRTQSYDVKYENLKARMFCPVDNSLSNGANVVTYHQFDAVGVAKMIADYATDIPRADVFAKEFSSPIRGLALAYGYSIQEARAAQFAGVPLTARKANACRQGIEQKLDQLAQSGDADHGLLGMLNQPNALTYTVLADGAGGGGSSTAWKDKTPDQIIRDMNEIACHSPLNTNDVEWADTLLVPLEAWCHITSNRMGDGSDTTILQFFLRNNPYIRTVESWNPLATAGAGSISRAVAYRRSPDALQLIIPQEFEQFAPEKRGLEVVTDCHARCGGVVMYYPLSMTYADGV